MPDREYPCPQCGSATDCRLECAGYPGERNGKKTIMVCVPACGGAIEFYCTNKACGWWHRTPNNRSDAATMPVAPPWLDKVLAELSRARMSEFSNNVFVGCTILLQNSVPAIRSSPSSL